MPIKSETGECEVTGYDEGWNDAVAAAIKLIEEERDECYASEKRLKEMNSGSSSIAGYRADGLRDIATMTRSLLRIEHFPPPLELGQFQGVYGFEIR